MSRRLRATAASGLVVRAHPAGPDTGRRIAAGQIVESHGASWDRQWAHVVTPVGDGWAALQYLEEAHYEVPAPAPDSFSVQDLALAAGIANVLAARWHPHVREAARRFDFHTPPRLAMWIAQCGHESISFSRLVENLNYSAAGLRETWSSRFPTQAIAEAYARQPEKIANKVYASRMGNGNEASGDGWRYRGRGLIQLTGRDNYRACGRALGIDLEGSPDTAATETVAALSAGWFWESRRLGVLADAGDITAVTRLINGGDHGLTDRRARWERAKAALGVAP